MCPGCGNKSSQGHWLGDGDCGVEQQLILFVADCESWHPKCDLHTLQYQFFSLATNKDTKPRRYTSRDGNIYINSVPSGYGMPTIFDHDLIMYGSTLIADAMRQGKMSINNEPITLFLWNYIEATERGAGSQQYKNTIQSLRRLKGLQLETNIKTNDKIETEGFSLIEHYRIIKKTKAGLASVMSLKLCDWLYRAIWNSRHELLAINKDYFHIRGPTERAVYQKVRKYCGNQPYWRVRVKTLYGMIRGYDVDPSDVKAVRRDAQNLSKFRTNIFERQVDLGTIPDYRTQLDPRNDMVIFYSRHHQSAITAALSTICEANNRRKKRKNKPVE